MSDDVVLILLFSFFFCGMTAFALLINSILLKFVKTLGTKNQPDAVVRWSAHTKPAIGGLAFFIIFLISICIYSVVFDANRIFKSLPISGLLIAGTLGFILGLTDDAYNTRPILKFIVQVLCGLIFVFTHSAIDVFDSTLINQVLTVVWVVGIMNSINMLDNMDGIATSVSAFIVIAAIGYIMLNGTWQSADFLILIGVLASLAGFLFFNWYPSTMYMGDTGSQFLGVILGYIGIHYCWNAATDSVSASPYFGLACLLLVFLLPLVDTAVVTVNRIARGRSPFVGGKDHTTHNLSYAGFSDRKVGGLYCLISAIAVSAFLLIISFSNSTNFVVIGAIIICFLAVFLTLWLLTVRNKRKGKSLHLESSQPLVKNE